ncbi:hypothetical protein MTP99_010590 [Tenebrio molitor]|nr:hypothetical protein MTP99_010590 [Tenebrio molitor]
MRNLEDFSVPNDGEITLCEINGRMQCANYEYANVSVFTNSVDKHPKIHITRDLLHHTNLGDEGRALFLPTDVPFLKQLTQVYSEQVGHETGIIIWHVDFNSLVARPSVSNTIMLYKLEHQPLMSLAWSPRGNILISVAANDSNILVWDVELNKTSPLKVFQMDLFSEYGIVNIGKVIAGQCYQEEFKQLVGLTVAQIYYLLQTQNQ